MLTSFTFHGHTIVADTNSAPSADGFREQGVSVTCTTAAIPYTVCRAVVFMVQNNVRVLIMDGADIRRH
jgi:hypothetical protein